MERLATRQKVGIFAVIWRERVREWTAFDASGIGVLAAWIALLIAWIANALGAHYRALTLVSAVHRGARSRTVNLLVEKMLPRIERPAGSTMPARISIDAYEEHVRSIAADRSLGSLRDPANLLRKRVLVLKSPQEKERGVILLDYMYTFPLFEALFDVAQIGLRYYIVLEPSWVGACTPDILSYTRYPFPVFVETTEPMDRFFVERLGSNLVSVDVSGNWWVDHRVMRPLAGIEKDVDVVMVAGWSRYKRHAAVFRALRTLKRRNRSLKVLLIGYSTGTDLTQTHIRRIAAYYGVESMLEFREGLPVEEVNYHLNRAKVHLLWSRKEGYNRAVIEAMLAGVPCILREGHNYGHPYPYINSETGCFANERNLAEKILWMIDNYQRFKPREWVLGHMSCLQATSLLSDAIRRVAVSNGEHWTTDLVVKNVHLNRMKYWNSSDDDRFEQDYRLIRRMSIA